MLATKETRELKIINDINNLSLRELEDIYLKDQETYEKFLEEYGRAFCVRLNYQLRASEQYDKIFRLFKDGVTKYPSEKALDITSLVVDTLAYVTHKYEVRDEYSTQDRDQARALFYEEIGINKINRNLSYEEIVNGIYESSVDYDNRGEFTIDDYNSYITYVLNTCSDQLEIQRAVDKYKLDHPLSDRCNDIYYLFFVNYMLTARKSLVDDEFIKNAKGIIDMSKVVKNIDYSRRPGKDYTKLANFTLKNIKNFERYKERQNGKERAQQKRLVRKLFPKNHK